MQNVPKLYLLCSNYFWINYTYKIQLKKIALAFFLNFLKQEFNYSKPEIKSNHTLNNLMQGQGSDAR